VLSPSPEVQAELRNHGGRSALVLQRLARPREADQSGRRREREAARDRPRADSRMVRPGPRRARRGRRLGEHQGVREYGSAVFASSRNPISKAEIFIGRWRLN